MSRMQHYVQIAGTVASVLVVGAVACSMVGSAGGGGGGGGGANNLPPPTVTPLATGINCPYNIVVDSSQLYWVDGSDGSVGTVGVNGSPAPQLLAPAQGPPQSFLVGWDITQDTNFVYFTVISTADGDRCIEKVPKIGGPVTLLACHSFTRYPAAARGCTGFLGRIHPSFLFTNDFTPGQLFFGDTCGVFELSTGVPNAATVNLIFNARGLGPDRIVTGDNVLVHFSPWGVTNAVVVTVPFEGGMATQLPTRALDNVQGIVVPTSGAGSGSVFWIERGNTNTVKQLKPGASGPITLAGGVLATTNARALAVDNANVYFAQGNQIAKVPIGGGVVTVVAGVADSNGIAGIAVPSNALDTSVYWASTGSGMGQGSIRKAFRR